MVNVKQRKSRRLPNWLVACTVLAALMSYAEDNPVRIFHGEIADTQCSMNVHSLTRSHKEMLKSKSMGGTSRSCTLYCIQYLGGDFVLSSEKDVYRLDNQEMPKKFAGQEVKLSGSLSEDGKTIHVVDISPAVDKKPR